MYESNQDGMPAWRPLFLEFPDDPKCYTDKNLTFMFGKSILVANVVERVQPPAPSTCPPAASGTI